MNKTTAVAIAATLAIATLLLFYGGPGHVSQSKTVMNGTAPQARVASRNLRGFFNPERTKLWAHPEFAADRMVDKSYQAIVWQYWLKRDMDAAREREPQLAKIEAMFISNGVPKEILTEVLRTAYSDISHLQQYDEHAWSTRRRVEEGMQKAAQRPDQQERETVLNRLQESGSNVIAEWISERDAFEQWATKRTMRDTGITDPKFYDELWSIRFKHPAMPINTNMASNETLF